MTGRAISVARAGVGLWCLHVAIAIAAYSFAGLLCLLGFAFSLSIPWHGALLDLPSGTLWPLVFACLLLPTSLVLMRPMVRRRRGLMSCLAFLMVLWALAAPWSRVNDRSRSVTECDQHSNIRFVPGSAQESPNVKADPGYIAHHNSNGLRGPEIDSSKPAIVLVGDSFIYGVGVEDDQTISMHLSRTNPEYDWINAGMPGDNLVGALQRLNGYLKSYKPHVVVLGVHANDMNPVSSNSLCKVPALCRYRIPFNRMGHRRVQDEEARLQMLLHSRGRLHQQWAEFETTLQPSGANLYVYQFTGEHSVLEAAGIDTNNVVTEFRAGRCNEPDNFHDFAHSSHPNENGTRCVAQEIMDMIAPVLEQKPGVP